MDAYVDGLFIVSQSLDISIAPIREGTCGIGGLIDPYGGFAYGFDGSADDIRIYNCALSEAEVIQLFYK